MKLAHKTIAALTLFAAVMFVREVSTGQEATPLDTGPSDANAETLWPAQEFNESSGPSLVSARVMPVVAAVTSMEALVEGRLRRLQRVGTPIVLHGRVVGESVESGVWPKTLDDLVADSASTVPVTRVVVQVLSSRAREANGRSFHILFLGGELPNGDTLSIPHSIVPSVGDAGIFFAARINGEAFSPVGSGFVRASLDAEKFTVGALPPMRIADALSKGGDRQ